LIETGIQILKPTISRRQFGIALAATTVPAVARAQSPWGGPVLDIHLHPRQPAGDETLHMEGSGVTKAVLLAHASQDNRAKASVAKYPDRLVWFTNPDVNAPNEVDLLKDALRGGAIGIGELQNHVLLDGPEMRRAYEVAADFKVPVLLHFQEGTSNSGFARLPSILKEYSRTIFIGHATSWWANISTEVDDKVSYPSGRVKPGGLTDHLLADYPNLYGDLSANSGRNALERDPDFAADFIARQKSKLMFGSDCTCRDGRGTGAAQGKCVARETLSALQRLASPEAFLSITWGNGIKLLKISV
jgi:predicted TIM-barrel fold metal-dependent hydrolase